MLQCRTFIRGIKTLQRELLLEKYTSKPICVKINDDDMLDCGGVVVADNILLFDAATDAVGAVHGVLLNKDGQIIYFRLADGLPISKSIAKGISQSSLKQLSITEQDGILHILIVKCEKNFTVHHYRTRGNSWVRSIPKIMDSSTEYIDSCPCDDGRFAILLKCAEKETLYLECMGKWQQLQHLPLPEAYTDASMSYLNGKIEIATDTVSDGVKVFVLAALDTSGNENNKKTEDNMANGSIINSKYINELHNNTSEIEALKEQLSQLKISAEGMSKVIENAEKQYKYITMCREALKQHDTQINQLNIKLQELINRFNGFAKQSRS